MDAFTHFKATAIPVDIINCDTDQIIPARFLRYGSEREGYANYFFHDLRYNADGSEKPDFILNIAPFGDGKVVVADLNWGCGSSREAAVNVLVANGIRAVIAPSFGDIHYTNCTKNGVLPVRLARADCYHIRAQLHDNPAAEIAFDLETQQVTGPDSTVYDFEIGAFEKHCLLNGLDDISLTLQYEEQIAAFEQARTSDYGWLD